MNRTKKYKSEGKYNEEKISEFANFIYMLLRSDRDVTIGVGGMTGEGKSTFVIKLVKEYCKIAGIKFSFDMLTWSRKEILTWIDGKPNSPKDETTGLKEGQKAEYTPIIADELFKMFYKRTWFDKEQIGIIATLNMCRDRHIFLAGNIPNFWHLDKAFQDRIRFYAYVDERGFCDIYMKDNSPFNTDQWNYEYNKYIFFESGNCYTSRNYLYTIRYEDLTPKEKADYLEVRNTKRVKALQEDELLEKEAEDNDMKDQVFKEWKKNSYKKLLKYKLEQEPEA